MKKIFIIIFLSALSFKLSAQIGEHRNTFSLGVNGGYTMSTMPFVPKVSQSWFPGMTFGLSARYISEKYFSTICGISAELNYTQAGWKEKIVDLDKNPVYNARTGQNDEYQKRLTYLQLPILCHLGWGKEEKGLKFFFEGGPQFGLLLGEKTKTNFSCDETASDYGNFFDRANRVYAQDTIEAKKKIDYGIAAGVGLEFSAKHVGHFILHARYYYGLGNLFGATKKDYFSRSNQNAITVKLTYLFDLSRKKKKEKNSKL